jgi:hypothetical protein
LEARVGIEPTHKGFAVFAVQSKLLTNMGISVGRFASKLLNFALPCRLLAAKWQPELSRFFEQLIATSLKMLLCMVPQIIACPSFVDGFDNPLPASV